jgi:membrane protein insertase Oxa1/YidC/SpoIIIJ
VTAKQVLDAVTPGVYISLAIGGLVYLVSPIMLGVAFALSSRMAVGAQQARRALVTAFFVVGFLAVVGVLNVPASFGDWWSFVGVWSLIICWSVLLAVSLSVRAELKRRAAEQASHAQPWG